MLRQSPFQGRIIAALDTAPTKIARAEQTGISSARINHFAGDGDGDREGGGTLCPVASHLLVNVCARFQ